MDKNNKVIRHEALKHLTKQFGVVPSERQITEFLETCKRFGLLKKNGRK